MFSNYFYDLHKYKSFKHHPSYFKLGAFWSYFYLLRTVFAAYLVYRISKLLYKTGVSQWNGEHSLEHTILKDEYYYKDLHRDINDLKAVNFRYSDHEDCNLLYSHLNHDYFKAEADYAKGLIKHFRSLA